MESGGNIPAGANLPWFFRIPEEAPADEEPLTITVRAQIRTMIHMTTILITVIYLYLDLMPVAILTRMPVTMITSMTTFLRKPIQICMNISTNESQKRGIVLLSATLTT